MLVDWSVISSFCWLMRLVWSAARVESILKPRSRGWTTVPVSPDWYWGLRRLIVASLFSRLFVQAIE